jgi:hypothetical protein
MVEGLDFAADRELGNSQLAVAENGDPVSFLHVVQ